MRQQYEAAEHVSTRELLALAGLLVLGLGVTAACISVALWAINRALEALRA